MYHFGRSARFAATFPTSGKDLGFRKCVDNRIGRFVVWSVSMIDFEKLHELAGQIRSFIQMSDDKARALRVVVAEHDVVLGIFPVAGEGVGLHVIKGEEILRQIAVTNSISDYSHTAIAFHNRDQAVALQQMLAARTTPTPAQTTHRAHLC